MCVLQEGWTCNHPACIDETVVRELVEVLRCVGRGLCMLKTSDLGNNAGSCVLDLNIESMLMSWELFVLVTL